MASLHLLYSTASAELAKAAVSQNDTIVLMGQAVALASSYKPDCKLLASASACQARALSPSCGISSSAELVQLSVQHSRVITWP
jgi:sulfur transfer complex TusBCD TusB component (DsrH family)